MFKLYVGNQLETFYTLKNPASAISALGGHTGSYVPQCKSKEPRGFLYF